MNTFAEVSPQTESAAEEESPLAIVSGIPLLVMPQDLYIPPEALRVFLETFQGPLDLLLYLIKKSNLDILDIPIAKITEQYVQYVELMKVMQLELVGEYLVMAAMLAEIKSLLLLPKAPDALVVEDDPRAELVRRLKEYERIQIAANAIDAIPRLERDFHRVLLESPEVDLTLLPMPDVALNELYAAFRAILSRAALHTEHVVQPDSLSLRERMTDLLHRLQEHTTMEFSRLFTVEEGRLGVVMTFIAILELLKQALIEIIQVEEYNTIHVKAVQND